MHMPQNKSNETIYEDINEVLSAPSSAIVRYGIGVMGVIMLILFLVLLLVKYTEGFRFVAVLKLTESVPVYSGKENTRIMASRVANGTTVKKGKILLVTRNSQTGLNDTVFAPVD